MGEIWTAGGKMLLCALGSPSFWPSARGISALPGSRRPLSRRLREHVCSDQVDSFSMEEINRFLHRQPHHPLHQ